MLRLRSRTMLMAIQDSRNLIASRGIHRKSNYYDLLGITPKATQADVKKAFYKLSMEFHPDKSTGNESKFKEISTAYEVLGNLKLRRLYDRGVLPVGVTDYRNVDVEVETETEFGRQNQYPYAEQFARKQTPRTGKTQTYDYEAWTRAHYSDNFRPDNRKAKYMYMRAHRVTTAHQAKMERIIWLFGSILLSLVIFNSTRNPWDIPRKKQEDAVEEEDS